MKLIKRFIFLSLFVYAVFNNYVALASCQEKLSLQQTLSLRIDSLEKINRDTAICVLMSALENSDNQENKIFVYNRLAKLYQQAGMMRKVEQILKKSIEDSRSTSIKYKQLFELAYFYNIVERYDTAKIIYDQLLDYYRKIKDTVNLGMVFSSYGSALEANGQKEQALHAYYKAVKLLKNSDKYLNLGASYENIAYVNSILGYEKRTIKNYLNAIEAYKKLDDDRNLAAAYANLGVSYKRIEKYDSALYYYKKSNEIADKHIDKSLLAQNALNMGNVFSEKGDSLQAKQMYSQSLEISLSNDLFYGQYVNYINLGQWYYDAKTYHKAIDFLIQGEQLAKDYNFPDQDILYNTLANSWEQLGNYKAAYQTMRKFNQYQDSTFKEKKHKELMELETKYETQKKEADILRLQKERKLEHLKNTIIITVAILLILILGAILIWNNQKRKILAQKALLASKENEKVQKELELQNNELIASSLHIAQLKDFSQEISDRIKALKPTVKKQTNIELEDILKLLNQKINDEQVWQDFDRRFKELNKPFINKLIHDCPDLTQAELRICMLLYLNLTSKEIAQMTNRSHRTVENLRYRIRNKLNIDKDINLVTYLHQL